MVRGGRSAKVRSADSQPFSLCVTVAQYPPSQYSSPQSSSSSLLFVFPFALLIEAMGDMIQHLCLLYTSTKPDHQVSHSYWSQRQMWQDATSAHLDLVCQASSLLLFASVLFQLHNVGFIFAFCPLKFLKDHNVLSSSLDTWLSSLLVSNILL